MSKTTKSNYDYDSMIDFYQVKGHFINVFEEMGSWILMIHTYTNVNGELLKAEDWSHKGPYKTRYKALNKAFEELVKLS